MVSDCMIVYLVLHPYADKPLGVFNDAELLREFIGGLQEPERRLVAVHAVNINEGIGPFCRNTA